MEPKEKRYSKVDVYGHGWPYAAKDEVEMKQEWSGAAFFLTLTLLSILNLANDTSGCLKLRTGIPTIKSSTIYSFSIPSSLPQNTIWVVWWLQFSIWHTHGPAE